MTDSRTERRGSPKGDRRRARIIEAARSEFAARGYANASMGSVAERVGISRSGLLHHFATKEALIMAVLRERQPPEDDRFQHSLDRAASRTVDDVATLLERNQTDPEWVAFYSGSLAEALRADHPAREFFTFRYRLFRASLAQSLRNAAEDGTIRADVPAPELAALIIAVLDGLQQQWLYDADLDMVALYRTFRRLLDAPGRPTADEPRR